MTPPANGAAQGMPAWRRNQIVITVSACLVFAGFTLVLPFLPYFVEMVGVSGRAVNVWSGALLSIAPLLAALMAPLWGRLADRYGMKLMVQRTTVAMIIHWVLMSFASSVWHLLALRTFLGLFSGFATMSVALVTHGAPRERIGGIVGTLQAAQILAAAAGPFIGGILYESIGIRGTCLITALFCCGGFALITFAYSDDLAAGNAIGAPRKRFALLSLLDFTPAPEPSLRAALEAVSEADLADLANRAPVADPAPVAVRGPGRAPLRTIVGLPGFAGVATVLFVATVLSRSFALVTPIHVRTLAAGAGGVGLMAGIAVSAGSFAEALSALIQGRLSERIHPRVLIFIGLALASVAVLPMILAKTVTGFVALRLAQGFVAGGTLTLGYTIAGGFIPDHARATGYGLLSSAAMMGGAVGPILAGLVSYGFGMVWVFASATIAYAALTLLALRGVRREVVAVRKAAPPPRPYIPVPR